MSFRQIWNMSFGFLGIQFGFALQNGNASRILQTFGALVPFLAGSSAHRYDRAADHRAL